MLDHCPACAAPAVAPFVVLRGLPVHGTAVLPDPVAARAVPVGDQELVLCPTCGVVYNRVFDPALLDYTGAHEESQHHSPRFTAYAEQASADWVRRFDLRGRPVVEVGCGSGDFAAALLDAGVGSVTGVDPHFTADRVPPALVDRLTAVPEFFTARHVAPDTAALVCRHTLEHIPALAEFGAELVEGLRGAAGPFLLAEVPDLGRILAEGAFWDLQYEHCSSFTPLTMAGFLRGLGFADPQVRTVYADQYVVAEATVNPVDLTDPVDLVDPLDPAALAELDAACRGFAARMDELVRQWRDWLTARADAGEPVVVWGGGAKGLTFLNVVLGGPDRGVGDGPSAVRAVVDVNPGLQGRFMAGLGLPIIAPDALVAAPPADVLLMNPVYLDEVRGMLDARGLTATRLTAV